MPTTVEIDTNDEFEWAERKTVENTIFGRTYTDVTTTFDDGRILVENSQNGVLLTSRLTDPTDVLDIQSQTLRYDLSGTLLSTDTLDDDGIRREEVHTGGVLTEVNYTDENDAVAWGSVNVVFDSDGTVDSFAIDYDDDAGALSAIDNATANFLQPISYDADDSEDWMFIVEGRSGSRNWTYEIADNGNQTHTRYRDGIIEKLDQYDFADVEAWRSINTLYDAAGTIVTRFTFNDDGSSYTESFDAGVLTLGRLQDDANIYDWFFIETVFDAEGNPSSRTTDYSSRSTTEFFDEGVLTSILEVTGSLTVETFYDAEGNATRRETNDGNGNTSVEILRETTVQTDDAGTKSWSQITTVRDGDGVLLERETEFDNGTMRSETFENGVLSERTSIQADGDVTTLNYENGQRVAQFREDVSDAKSWDTISTTYDTDGDQVSKTVIYDNGTITDIRHVDGVIQSHLRTDASDAFGWSEVATVYDNGTIAARLTTFDEGDLTWQFYDDAGARAARVEFDGADDNAWTVKLTTWGAGGKEVTGYDSLDELPTEYADVVTNDDFFVFA